MSEPHLIAIVGGSGAGKTWLAERLQERIGKDAARISLDDFYFDCGHLHPSHIARVNFDHPRSIDWALVEEVLGACAEGRAVSRPCYDFATHRRTERMKYWKPKPVVLVDGLWLLRRPSIRRLFSLSIFIDCNEDLRFQRRLSRDSQERQRSQSSIHHQFYQFVAPMHQRFVEPQRARADVVLTEPPADRDVQRLAGWIKNLPIQ